MEEFLSKLPWGFVVLLCLTLGLAPFNPPHIWEKINMFKQGKLIRPVDWFDFFFHSMPWMLLILKASFSAKW
jgi:hypothetical protein